MCAVPSMAVFFFPEFRGFLLCCWGIFWVILKRCEPPPLLLISIPLSHSTSSEFLVLGLYILKSSQLFSTDLVHYHTSVLFLILPVFPCIMLKCSWAHTLSYLFIILLPVLVMLMWCVSLSHQIVPRVCICCVFLFVKFLSRDVSFVMPDIVLLLFHFQPLLSDLPSTTTRTCLLG